MKEKKDKIRPVVIGVGGGKTSYLSTTIIAKGAGVVVIDMEQQKQEVVEKVKLLKIKKPKKA